MKYTFLIAALCLALVANGQEPKFRHLDVSDGLPSSTIYQVFQDSKGYIWFSSEAGLTRFDGTYIENFTMDDGLGDNEVFGLFEDKKGRIWARSYNGRFSFFQNGYFYNENDFDYLEQLYAGGWVSSVFEDGNGYLFFALSKDGFIVLTPDNEVLHYNQKMIEPIVAAGAKADNMVLETQKVSVRGFQEAEKNKILLLTSLGEFLFDTKNKKLTAKKIGRTEVNKLYFVNEKKILGTKSADEAKVYEYSGSSELKLLFDGSEKEINARGLIPLRLNAKGELWMGSLGDGVFLISNFLTTPKLQHHYLQGKAVSYFLEDKEGNYWFSTLGEGVYMLPKNAVLTYTTEQGLISDDLYAVTGDGKGNIYVGTGDGALNKVDKNGNVSRLSISSDKSRGYDRISDIVVDNDQHIWASSDLGLKVFGRNVKMQVSNIKSMAKDAAGNVYLSSSQGVYQVDKNNQVTEIWNNRSDALSVNADGTLWIGTNHGLYYYDGKIVEYQGDKDVLFKSRVSDLEQTTNDILCICTYGNGLILKKGNGIRHLTTKDGLVGNVCRDVFIEKEDNTIWMATNTGISQFRVNEDDLAIEHIVNYSDADNLASNDIRHIYAEDNRVWVATSKGLSYFKKGKTQDAPVAPPVYITNLKIWEQDTVIYEKYTLPYDENNIRIGYTGISFSSGYRIRYKYKMEGIDNDWVYSDIPEAQYPILRPGSYTFRVKAINVDLVESETEATVEFVIRPPWWNTNWFRILAFLLVTGGGYFIVSSIVKNRQQKAQLRGKIVESEQMALRAQMNPHFVFNALNSIQHFITMEDEMSANYYLTRFSKLIRQVLENSKHSFISITEEIETLKLYLELEMLRFEGKFTYEIELSPDIDTYDTQIPSMIIQPFLENAIWHGLMPKVGDSELFVHFEQAEKFIICTIKDNGIGRKASAKSNENRSDKHTSTGISNTVKRLALLSNVKDESTLMQVTDLEEDGKALGTVFTLKIPFR